MATAKRTEYSRIPGIYEPVEYEVEYRFCDVCGSSDIIEVGSHASGFINGVFSLVIIVSFYGGVIAALIRSNIKICGGFGIATVISLVIYFSVIKYIEGNNFWKCNKCGNVHVT